MDIKLGIDNNELKTEFYKLNDEKVTELTIMNENNSDIVKGLNDDIVNVLATNINLSDKEKKVIDNLILGQIEHQNRQQQCFEELLKIWFGENILVSSSISDLQKLTKRFTECKKYFCKSIAQYLPDGENALYSAYYSLKKDGIYEEHTGDVCTIYKKEDVDMGQYSKYIVSLNKKIYRQYDILQDNFNLYLEEKAEEEEVMEEINKVPLINRIRIKSQRNTPKVLTYKPWLQFVTRKRKNRANITIDNFRKAITASKKRKVNPINMYQ